jgi:hypothetical protein
MLAPSVTLHGVTKLRIERYVLDETSTPVTKLHFYDGDQKVFEATCFAGAVPDNIVLELS